ncbi:hypothetical protein MGWOODY_Smn2263 [hydrothermal vent metagenome]|uniref:Uncharacterized protein n=1 Tax=hydrothermal vent metagenome TaxID=652676 RepID=A0A161K5F2_9ZZZZ
MGARQLAGQRRLVNGWVGDTRRLDTEPRKKVAPARGGGGKNEPHRPAAYLKR